MPPADLPSAGSRLPDNAISARGLFKAYRTRRGEKVALKGIDLDVPRGSFFGLLGPNGAGKSTFINILAGLVTKSAGDVRVWDRDISAEPRAARAAIGVVPQELHLDPFFTAREAIEFQAGLYGVPARERRTDAILAAMGLTEVADSYSRMLSGGMRRRLMVGKAMVHAPPVLVLDEPTAGVDVELRQQLWQFIRGLNGQGVTVVLTTHYLEEAEQLCDRIAIINRGEVVACDATPNLIARLDRKTLSITVDRDLTALPAVLARFQTEIRPFRRLAISYQPSRTQAAEVLAAVQAAGLVIHDLSTEEGNLEELFLMLTRRAPAPATAEGAGPGTPPDTPDGPDAPPPKGR